MLVPGPMGVSSHEALFREQRTNTSLLARANGGLVPLKKRKKKRCAFLYDTRRKKTKKETRKKET